MVDAESGQYLDFSTARPPVHVEVIQGRPIKGSAKARILAALDKLQASYTADLERNSQMGDGPKDDHYQRDLPVESLQPKGEVILDFGDSTVTIYPYLVTEYGKVYSDPFCFILGRLEDIIINDSWKKLLIKSGIPDRLISLIEDCGKIE